VADVVPGQHGSHDVALCVTPPLDTDVAAVRLATVPDADALLLVVWEGRTSTNACVTAKARLEGFPVKHVGLIYLR
jgi:Mrp family chromosome partitioning ATPase